ncbi:unnamed protein product [Rotaria magnacalcarata]|uniref:G-protein coupled receptors family 1 profile domain-containing protein n=1 Tax=Rotaria magnacalcarata TaxID=392030 RepID=A0A816C3A7_9BILA|nr:unnamed protein product [Rotaria magnacalcarata]CAF1616576.1 unnamed protein product [Rotaria magnacalcarata]CAF2038700.1 unnamed protein product [Rotaria magnacalcarata]CAF3765774.1 unnamed protein product [Rotaria magnacalcarata]CAF3900088.1 unnamed protein product [Rotaria magnacalcarata]
MESYVMKTATSNDDQLIALLTNTAIAVSRYGILVLVILGAVGNTLNIIVFSQRKLRSSPCTVYFLTSACIDLILTLTIALPRVLLTYNLDYSAIIGVLCKMRQFTYYSFSSLSVWMTALTTVDRFLISSPLATRRQMSSFRNTYGLIIASCILLTLIFGNLLYCAAIASNGVIIECSIFSGLCGYYNQIARVLTTLFIPETVIVIFSVGMIRNLRSLKAVPNMISNGEHTLGRIRKIDKELFKLMICQIVMLTISFLPLGVQRLYALITTNVPKSTLHTTIDGLTDEITSMTARFDNSLSFYVYLFAGGVLFRETILQWFRRIKRRQTIMPMTATAGFTRATIN